jgi:hypothetical protein
VGLYYFSSGAAQMDINTQLIRTEQKKRIASFSSTTAAAAAGRQDYWSLSANEHLHIITVPLIV